MFQSMHPSTPLPNQQQAVPLHVTTVFACRSSTRVGAGSRERVHTPWPCAMDHEGLLKAYVVCYRK